MIFPKIKLDDIKTTNDCLKFISIIFERIEPIQFLADREYCCYCVLKLIDLKNLERSSSSISENISLLLDTLKLKREDIVDPIDEFYEKVLCFQYNPVEVLVSFREEAKKDLNSVKVLLDHYEDISIIKSFVATERRPRNHEERTLFDFYLRCKNKSIEIENFIQVDSIHVAVQSARLKNYQIRNEENSLYEAASRNRIFTYQSISAYFEDGKLKHECNLNLNELDYRCLNDNSYKRWIYNLYSLTDDKGNLRELTKADSDFIFKRLMSRISQNPLIARRKTVFLELRELYNKKYWYGFYALGLPQIEGVISDLLKVFPNNKGSSLTDKLDTLRSDGDLGKILSQEYDYFQYCIPLLRNKFAHTGIDSEIDDKSKSLLIDLEFLVRTCLSLKSPITSVIRAGNKINDEDIDVIEVSNFIDCVSLAKKQNNYLLIKDWVRDINDKLKSIDIQKLLNRIGHEIDDKIVSIYQSINNEIPTFEASEINVFKDSMKDIVKNINTIVRYSNSISESPRNDILFVYSAYNLLSKYSKKDDKNVSSFLDKRESELKKIRFIHQNIEKNKSV